MHSFSNNFDKIIISGALMILFYCWNYVYLFKRWLNCLQFFLLFLWFQAHARNITLGRVFTLSFDFAGAVVEVEDGIGGGGCFLLAEGGEVCEVVEKEKIHLTIIVEVVVSLEVDLAPQNHKDCVGGILDGWQLDDLFEMHRHCSLWSWLVV